MMRPHCDRCDSLVDEHSTWVEDNEAPLDSHGVVMRGSGINPIWHIVINAGGSRLRQEDYDRMFCRACRIAILEAHVKALKNSGTTGGWRVHGAGGA